MGFMAGIFPVGMAVKMASRLLGAMGPRADSSFSQVFASTMAQQVMERYDANGDGALTAQELPGGEDSFGHFDSDRNGLISVGELEVGLTRAQADHRARVLAHVRGVNA